MIVNNADFRLQVRFSDSTEIFIDFEVGECKIQQKKETNKFPQQFHYTLHTQVV